MLTSTDLTWMRDVQERVMPGTIVITRAADTRDVLGGYTEVWAIVGTVTGRIYPMARGSGNAEFVAGGMVISETTWFATLPYGTSVTAKDRLVYDSRTWEIAKVNNSENYMTAVRCELIAHNEEYRIGIVNPYDGAHLIFDDAVNSGHLVTIGV